MMKAKKIGAWIGAALTCALLLVRLSAAIFLHTDFAHQYVLRLVTQGIQQAIGGRVEIGSIKFHWAHLGADLNRITLHGSEAESNAPLFAADRAGINLGLHLFRRQKVSVDD